jgi:hypothetical protein
VIIFVTDRDQKMNLIQLLFTKQYYVKISLQIFHESIVNIIKYGILI